jgi:hypothetical protein
MVCISETLTQYATIKLIFLVFTISDGKFWKQVLKHGNLKLTGFSEAQNQRTVRSYISRIFNEKYPYFDVYAHGT